MKKTIFVVISCVLLLGLVLASCADGNGLTKGEFVGVWPKGSDPTVAYFNNIMSRLATGLNWTDVEYTGTQDFEIPADWVTIWQGW